MINQFKQNTKRMEIFLPFTDYSKIESKKENIIKSIIFITISLVLEYVIVLYFSKIFSLNEFIDFINQYIETEINIVVLLLSFSIAYLTILISSEGANIKKLKEYPSGIEKFSLYQVLLIQLTYCIYSEIALLVLLLINKFFIPIIAIYIEIAIFIVSIIILLNIIFITFKNVKNIYLSFWN